MLVDLLIDNFTLSTFVSNCKGLGSSFEESPVYCSISTSLILAPSLFFFSPQFVPFFLYYCNKLSMRLMLWLLIHTCHASFFYRSLCHWWQQLQLPTPLQALWCCPLLAKFSRWVNYLFIRKALLAKKIIKFVDAFCIIMCLVVFFLSTSS